MNQLSVLLTALSDVQFIKKRKGEGLGGDEVHANDLSTLSGLGTPEVIDYGGSPPVF